jgi:glycosyltransferase involved in cell wall biosynthesis
LLFDPFNPEEIADRMLQWLNDPEDAARHAERAADKVRREHGLTAYAEAIRRTYERAVAGVNIVP